jgi:hypothetical protein
MWGRREMHAGKLERKEPFARSRSRWEDNIKIYVQEVGWEAVDWHNLAEDRDKCQAGWNIVLNNQVL